MRGNRSLPTLLQIDWLTLNQGTVTYNPQLGSRPKNTVLLEFFTIYTGRMVLGGTSVQNCIDKADARIRAFKLALSRPAPVS